MLRKCDVGMHKLASIAAAGLFLCASSAFADDAPHVVSAAVRSYESDATLVRVTCGLETGRFDVVVGGKRCSPDAPQADALPLRVSVNHRADGWDDVVFEADVPEGANASEMHAAVDVVARQLFTKLGTIQHRAAPVADDGAREEKPASSGRGMRGGGIALMSAGGASLGITAVIGLIAAIDSLGHSFGCGVSSIMGSSCGSKDFSGYGIAAGVAGGVGLLMLVTGGVVLSYAPPKSNVALNLGPTGGSLRVTF